MMFKKFRCLALGLALILVIVSGTTFAAKKPVKLIYGSVFEGDGCYGKGDAYFKKLVEKNSKGKILVELYPLCQLGSGAEMYQAVKTGAQQMNSSSPGPLIYRTYTVIRSILKRWRAGLVP
jgi:TRAP-type C4-dicarboxylate transport system substrate-binding protein